MKPYVWVAAMVGAAVTVGGGAFCGCGRDEATPGALGQVWFSADCAGGNGTCPVSGIDAPVAVGATVPLDLDLAIRGGSGLNLTLVSADTEVVDTVGYTLTGVNEGISAVLLTTPEGAVLDFFHVWVYRADGLRFHRMTEEGQDLGVMTGRCEMVAGQELILDVVPHAGVHRLVGNVEAAWSTDASNVSVLDEGVDGRRRVVARQPGTAVVTAELDGTSVELEVEVQP